MNNTEEKLTVNTEETLQKSIIDHENDAIATGNNEEKQKDKKKFTIKKKLVIICACILAYAAITSAYIAFLLPPKFVSVQDWILVNCCEKIISVSPGEIVLNQYANPQLSKITQDYLDGDIDAKDLSESELYTVMGELSNYYCKEPEDHLLPAIKYANKEFGFDDSLYDKMVATTSSSGIQSETNDKYSVTWEYNSETGLLVNYSSINEKN